MQYRKIIGLAFTVVIGFALLQSEFSFGLVGGALGGFVTVGMLGVAFVLLLVSLVKKRKNHAIFASVLLLSTLIGTWLGQGITTYREDVVGEEAQLVMRALDKHLAETGDYPENLDTLSPRWLTTIPAARIGLWSSFPFIYRKTESSYRLSYPVPYFLVREYSPETDQWTLHD